MDKAEQYYWFDRMWEYIIAEGKYRSRMCPGACHSYDGMWHEAKLNDSFTLSLGYDMSKLKIETDGTCIAPRHLHLSNPLASICYWKEYEQIPEQFERNLTPETRKLMEEKPLKMYVLIKDSLTVGQAMLAAAHAPISCFLTLADQNRACTSNMKIRENCVRTLDWAEKSFRKVICKVTAEEFEKAKAYGTNFIDYRVMVESGLGGEEVSIVFAPRNDWEPFFKSLKLYK